MMKNVIQILAIYLVLFAVQASRHRVRRGFCSTRNLEIHNGDYNIKSGNSVVKYTCNRDFFLYGVDKIVCYGTTWSSDPPVCISNTCQKIQATSTLCIVEEHQGSLLKFSCTVLYRLVGSDRLLCDGKDWSEKTPLCEPWEPPTSCDFEDPSLCGWSHHDDDDVDWKYHTGSTTTSKTGPEYDHTLGRSGHYMYFESSSPTKKGHKAILKSPLYPAAYSNQRCFSMWYHILGVGDIGDLELFIKPENVGLDNLNPVFKENKNVGELWHVVNTNIDRQTEPFQIYIVGTRGSSYRSDFAIDDVSLYECAGVSMPKSTATSTRAAAANTTAASVQTHVATTISTARSQTNAVTTAKPSPKTANKTAIPTLKTAIVRNRTAKITMKTTTKTMTQLLNTALIRKITQKPTQLIYTTYKQTSNALSTSTSDRITLAPRINPNIPVRAPKQQTKDKDSSHLAYILVGVGIVVAIALGVGVGLYCYQRDRIRHDNFTGTGAAVNLLYNATKADDAALSFTNDDYTHI